MPVRDRLLIPLAAVTTAVWAAAAAVALATDRTAALALVTGPYGVVCGYVFGVSFFNRVNGNGAK